jgi:hypothetical protein
MDQNDEIYILVIRRAKDLRGEVISGKIWPSTLFGLAMDKILFYY